MAIKIGNQLFEDVISTEELCGGPIDEPYDEDYGTYQALFGGHFPPWPFFALLDAQDKFLNQNRHLAAW